MIINVSPDAVLWSGVLAQQKGLQYDLGLFKEDSASAGLEVALATLITHLDDENIDPPTIHRISRLGLRLVNSYSDNAGISLAKTLKGIDPEKYERAATAARATISQAFKFALTSQATDRATATLGAEQRIVPSKTFEEFEAFMKAHNPELYELVKSDKIEYLGKRYEVQSNLGKIASDWEKDFEKAQLAVSYLVRLYLVCDPARELLNVLEFNSQLFTVQHVKALQKIKEDGLLEMQGEKANLTRFLKGLKLARPDLF